MFPLGESNALIQSSNQSQLSNDYDIFSKKADLQLPADIAIRVKEGYTSGKPDLSNLNLCHLSDQLIDLLKSIPNLVSLNLSKNTLTNVDGLEKLTQLTTLSLNFNQLRNVDGLENLTQLTNLNLAVNRLTNMPKLEKLTQLRTLILSYNQLKNVDGLENLTQLTNLNLAVNRLTNMPNLEKLTQLTNLDLCGNRLMNLDGLANLTQLTTLDLGANGLENVDRLANLGQLTRLSLNGNPLMSLPDEMYDWQNSCTISILGTPNLEFLPHENGPVFRREVLNVNSNQPLANTNNSLVQSILGLDLSRRTNWKQFESERHAKSFAAWLTNLKGTEDFKNNKAHLQEHVKALLVAMETDEELRLHCFLRAEEFTSSCHDNITWGLIDLSLDKLNRETEREHLPREKLIAQGRKMYPVHLIKQAARAKAEEIRQSNPDFKEDLEIAVVYLLRLQHHLSFASPVKSMKYQASIASYINNVDFEALGIAIQEKTNTDNVNEEFIDFVSSWLPMQSKLAEPKEQKRSEIEKISHERLEDITIEFDKILNKNETDKANYSISMNKVGDEVKKALQKLDMDITREYLTNPKFGENYSWAKVKKYFS